VNDDVLVVVHGYSGDVGWTQEMLGLVLHHERPVLLLSPEDAPAIVDHPKVTCKQGGLRGWQGPEAVHRQIEHWRIALGHDDADWFLLNDADSFVIEPEIPDYMFEEQDVLWCTPIGHFGNWRGEAGGDNPWPNLQPPYFAHRRWFDRALEAVDAPSHGDLVPTSCTVVDGRITCEARLVGDREWKWEYAIGVDGLYNMLVMRNGFVARTNPLGITTMNTGISGMAEGVRHGATWLHPIKNQSQMSEILGVYHTRVRGG